MDRFEEMEKLNFRINSSEEEIHKLKCQIERLEKENKSLYLMIEQLNDSVKQWSDAYMDLHNKRRNND